MEDVIQAWLDAGWTLRAVADGVQAKRISATVPAPRLVGVFVSKGDANEPLR